MADPFLAEIRIFGFSFAPRDWATCDGQLMEISQNPALYALIGTYYGGDGRVTMGLPNLKGRMPMHPGTGPGLTYHALGEMWGVPSVSLSEAEIPSHTHTVKTCLDKSDTNTPGTDTLMGVALSKLQAYSTSSSTTTQMSSSSLATAGANQAHNNIQPYLTINFCICLDGVFPQRQ